MGERIKNAQIEWSGDSPRSVSFRDVYFSGDGPQEARHVFLGGNRLSERFAVGGLFTICELGFGTGLNFLETWAQFDAAKPAGARLNYVSIEISPLSCGDLERSHSAWPAHAARARRLRALAPPLAPGSHILAVSDDVTLMLVYDDALDALRALEGGVDAWFFDGFAPAKNPEMWRSELFVEAARLSNSGATFATFSVAGEIRRALAAAGFSLEKRAGFGRKKEMLAGAIAAPAQPRDSRRAPWFQRANAARLSAGNTLAIVGGGIAGASLAFAARRAGLQPTIIDAGGLARGASGNRAAIVMPRLDLAAHPAARFFTAAYLHVVRLLGELNADVFLACGAFLGAKDEDAARRQDAVARAGLLPEGWLERRRGGLWLPQSGVLRPERLVAVLAADSPLIPANARMLHPHDNSVAVELDDGRCLEFDGAVLANGCAARRFREGRALALNPVAGQIDWFPEAVGPAHVVAFGPYAAPAPGGGLVIGATYETGVEMAETSLDSTRSNLAALLPYAPELVRGLDATASQRRASMRCQTPDRIPIAGPAPDFEFAGAYYDDLRFGRACDYPPAEMIARAWLLTGLGSRGFVAAPLSAAHVVAEMTGTLSPLDFAQAEALHPTRFFIRDLRRGARRRPPDSASGSP